MAPKQDQEDPFTAERALLTKKLEQVKGTDQEARVAKALAALDPTKTIAKRLKWEELAEYLDQHPDSRAGEIAAAMEVPLKNVDAHLHRGDGTVFQTTRFGWKTIKGWQGHSRDRKYR
jgi:DNA-directed RNA polymerase specialized sigma24 family protein